MILTANSIYHSRIRQDLTLAKNRWSNLKLTYKELKLSLSKIMSSSQLKFKCTMRKFGSFRRNSKFNRNNYSYFKLRRSSRSTYWINCERIISDLKASIGNLSYDLGTCSSILMLRKPSKRALSFTTKEEAQRIKLKIRSTIQMVIKKIG